ncbi:MAG: amidohydrolase family protein [Lachnospiraceae bacterium]|nr:amidohydrolase family protein [Lachnospiraceae bacterium]
MNKQSLKQSSEQSFILKGNICYSKSREELACIEQGFLVCVDGVSQGVFRFIPEEYKELEVIDYGDSIIIPGMNDLHLHAPQYTFRGTGMDLELLDWLETYTFPEERKYENADYAKRAYSFFAEDLKNSATTRAVIFATIHVPGTLFLMDKLEETGLKTLVGKVNMDRNCADFLSEQTAEASLEATRLWLEQSAGRYRHTAPILTPRFVPTCSDDLLKGLGQIQKEFGLPMQSHLSENLSEIEWVKDLCPWSTCYGDVYRHFGLFGTPEKDSLSLPSSLSSSEPLSSSESLSLSLSESNAKSIMAHCVYSSEEEIDLMKQHGVYIAHCPQSNSNLASGIAPVRDYLNRNLNVGLGTDIAGGASLSMFRCMADAITVSKLRWRLVDQSLKPLTAEEAFYLATIGGGSFFGKVGSFENGYEFDALVLDDSRMRTAEKLSLKERLERYIYLAEESGKLIGKYVGGKQIF